MNVRIALVVLSLVGCGNKPRSAEEIRVANQAMADELIAKMIFVRHPDVDSLCFAYHWGGMGNGGPAIATLPCSEVPDGLLYIANPGRAPEDKFWSGTPRATGPAPASTTK